jgi:flagellar assembly protein FliH
MAVIKSHNTATLLKGAIVLDLGDLNRQAQEMRAAAEEQARRIRADGQAEAQRLIAGAHAQGLAAGRAEGLAQGLEQGRAQGRTEALTATGEQLKQLEQAWLKALEEWDQQRQALERAARQAVLELAVRLGHKVTQRVIEVDPQVVEAQVAAALTHVLRALDVTVRVCPDDRALVEAALPALLARFPKLQHVQVASDPAVGRGGCVLTYGQAVIDATIDTQLRRMTELLLPSGQRSEVSGQECPPTPAAPPS